MNKIIINRANITLEWKNNLKFHASNHHWKHETLNCNS